MDFTREPVVETIITPKEGFKLVVRSSKSSAQEEYFVDAVEVVSFGNSLFFRSLERPKSFLVPVTDYEILEVREARMVLKNVGLERSIKIGGGREQKPAREHPPERAAPVEEPLQEPAQVAEGASDGRLDKRRDKRRHSRRRRGRDEVLREGADETAQEDAKIDQADPAASRELSQAESSPTPSILSSILPPPPTLISESIARYKDNALFKGAFFMKDEEKSKPQKENIHEGNAQHENEDQLAEADENAPPVHSSIEEEQAYHHRTFSLDDTADHPQDDLD